MVINDAINLNYIFELESKKNEAVVAAANTWPIIATKKAIIIKPGRKMQHSILNLNYSYLKIRISHKNRFALLLTVLICVAIMYQHHHR